MQRGIHFAALSLAMLVCTLPAAEPDVFVDAGACPGEGCSNSSTYVAQANVTVFETPSLTAKKIGEIRADMKLRSTAGEVHTVPTRFEISRQHDDFHPSDDVFALTYLGEGYFRVLHNDVLTQADLGFSPWGGSTGKRCNKPEHCWGRLVKDLEFAWWLRVVSESGLEGWVVADRSIQEIQED